MLKTLQALMRRRTNAYKHTSQAAIYPHRSKAGPYVSQYGAMTLAGYYAAIRVLSSAFVQMPWKVYRLDGQRREHAIDHPVDRVLRYRANPEMSAATFKELMMHWVISWGNAYAEIEREPNTGRVRALWPIEPWRVTVRRTYDDTQELFYQVTNYNDQPLAMDPADILHFRNIGDDIEGWSVVRLAANALGLYEAEQGSMSSQLKNSARLSGIISPPGNASMPQDKLTAAKQSFRESMQGADNHGNVWFSGKGLNFQPLQIPNSDMQLLESRKFSIIEMCRFIGVPPSKVYDLEFSTYNNVEQMNIDFLVDTVGPWICRLEEEANYKLIVRPRLYETRLDPANLTRADSKSRAEWYTAMRNLGAMSPNDVRSAEDMNPIPNGDQYFVQSNMAPLEAFTNMDTVGQTQSAEAEPEAEEVEQDAET